MVEILNNKKRILKTLITFYNKIKMKKWMWKSVYPNYKWKRMII